MHKGIKEKEEKKEERRNNKDQNASTNPPLDDTDDTDTDTPTEDEIEDELFSHFVRTGDHLTQEGINIIKNSGKLDSTNTHEITEQHFIKSPAHDIKTKCDHLKLTIEDRQKMIQKLNFPPQQRNNIP